MADLTDLLPHLTPKAQSLLIGFRDKRGFGGFFGATDVAEIVGSSTGELWREFQGLASAITKSMGDLTLALLDEGDALQRHKEFLDLRKSWQAFMVKPSLFEIFAQAHNYQKLHAKMPERFEPLLAGGVNMVMLSQKRACSPTGDKVCEAGDAQPAKKPRGEGVHNMTAPTAFSLASIMKEVMQNAAELGASGALELVQAKDEALKAKEEALQAQKDMLRMAKANARKSHAAHQRMMLVKSRLTEAQRSLQQLRGIVSNRTRLEAVAAAIKKEAGLVNVGVDGAIRHVLKNRRYANFQASLRNRAQERYHITPEEVMRAGEDIYKMHCGAVHSSITNLLDPGDYTLRGQYAIVRELFREVDIAFEDVQAEQDAELDAIRTPFASDDEDNKEAPHFSTV
ncbi:hypothetical protein HDU87_000858 [Geranomyces variabilis]|uniref:Uncharacterized protein n=1 Tax=Geranomyces variabilis TaxID=109894 RepID=A0AAD5TBS8_9FUNG|nr:hypothetical protein HDU87_000858 [Geranomyces variabilis]